MLITMLITLFTNLFTGYSQVIHKVVHTDSPFIDAVLSRFWRVIHTYIITIVLIIYNLIIIMRYQVLNEDNVVVCEFHALDDVAAKSKFVRLFWSSKNFFYLTRKPEPLYIIATNCRKS